MSNLTHRAGSALTADGFGIAAIATQDPEHAKAWIISGALLGVAGQVFKIIWPETEGGQKAADQLPTIPKP